MHLMSTYEMHTECVCAAMMMMMMTTTTAAANRERKGEMKQQSFTLEHNTLFSVCDANFLTYFRERRNLFYSNV